RLRSQEADEQRGATPEAHAVDAGRRRGADRRGLPVDTRQYLIDDEAGEELSVDLAASVAQDVRQKRTDDDEPAIRHLGELLVQLGEVLGGDEAEKIFFRQRRFGEAPRRLR